MNELVKEALVKLDCFIKSGIRGFAQQAYDRLTAYGMTERSLGRVEEWDQVRAAEIYEFLLND